MIRYDAFRLVTLPRAVADLLSPPEPPYRTIRPDVRSVDDALAWLHDQPWTLSSDAERRRLVKWLFFLRHVKDRQL